MRVQFSHPRQTGEKNERSSSDMVSNCSDMGNVFFEYRKSVKEVKHTECILKELDKMAKELEEKGK